MTENNMNRKSEDNTAIANNGPAGRKVRQRASEVYVNIADPFLKLLLSLLELKEREKFLWRERLENRCAQPESRGPHAL